MSPISLTNLSRNVLWNFVGQVEPLFGLLTPAWMVMGCFSLLDFGLGRMLSRLVSEKLGERRSAEIPQLVGTALLLMACLGPAGGAAQRSPDLAPGAGMLDARRNSRRRTARRFGGIRTLRSRQNGPGADGPRGLLGAPRCAALFEPAAAWTLRAGCDSVARFTLSVWLEPGVGRVSKPDALLFAVALAILTLGFWLAPPIVWIIFFAGVIGCFAALAWIYLLLDKDRAYLHRELPHFFGVPTP